MSYDAYDDMGSGPLGRTFETIQAAELWLNEQWDRGLTVSVLDTETGNVYWTEDGRRHCARGLDQQGYDTALS